MKLNLSYLVLLIGISICGLTQNGMSETVLDKDSSAFIVISTTATQTESFAAEELQKYIEQMIGRKIALITDDVETVGIVLSVGKTKYAEKYRDSFSKSIISTGNDSFVVNVEGNFVILVGGGDRGTIYSVYEFLEQQGCRWFFPGELGEVVPRKQNLDIKPQVKIFEPDFVQRSIDGGNLDGMNLDDIIDWSVKNRINWRFGMRDVQVRKILPSDKWDVWQKRGGQLHWQWICHNFSHIMPNSKYFDEHPEYYSLYKGERIKLSDKGMGGGNICTTNRDVIRISADFIIDWFDKNPDGMLVPLWPADGVVKWCECNDCSKLGGKNFTSGESGSMSLRLVTFVNEVARLVSTKYPDRYILCPAYSNYIEPVENVVMEKNVIVQYCLHGCYSHGLEWCPQNQEHKKKLESWTKTSEGRIGVWEYFLIGDYGPQKITAAPLPVIYRARDTIKYLKSTGCSFYFTQSRLEYWKHNPLVYYVVARLLWDADQDFDILWDDFFQNMYGQAAEPISKLYRLIEDTVEDSNWHPKMYSDVTTPSGMVFSEDLLNEAKRLLAEAQSKGNTDIVNRRLDVVRELLDYIESNVTAQNLSGLDENSLWRIERKENYYVINADGQEIPDKRYAELVLTAKDTGNYDGNFKRNIFRSAKREVPIVFLENDRVKVGVIPGIGGRIIRLIDKKNGWNFFKESVGQDSLESIGVEYFVYGGYEEYIGAQFASPGWENEFDYKLIELDGIKSLILTLEISDYLLKRTISISNGNSPEVTIKSTLTNLSKEQQNIKLRVHPLIGLGLDSKDCSVYLGKDGSYRISNVERENGSLSVEPDGIWAVANNEKNIGLVNYFDSSQAKGYICKTGEDNFTFELIGEGKNLAYRDSLEIKHVYRVVDDVKNEIDGLFAAAKGNAGIDMNWSGLKNEVLPLHGNAQLQNGKAGKSASFAGSSGIDYSSAYINANAGTIEMWIKLADNPMEMEDEFLLAVGNNIPGWFVCAVGGGKITYLNKSGISPYTAMNEHYCSLFADISAWKKGQWHHVALVWASMEKEQCLVQIYIDGKLTEERYSATIGRRFDYPTLNIGYSLVNRNNTFKGCLDELRISNYPKTDNEIETAYRSVLNGEALTLETGTIFLLNFETELKGLSSTIEEIDSDLIKIKVDAIIK